jgi:plastocyanin
MNLERLTRCLFATLACAIAQAAAAGMVTVNVATKSGAAAEDAVIFFDPLDATPAPAHGSASIDQINKQFVPRVSVVRTGTAVSFPNSDNIRHQVYSFSPPKKFTLKLYAGLPSSPVTFDKPGLVVLGCNIHDNMVGFVGIVDTPYFAKTPASGAVTLNLPAGHYRLQVWHPDLAIPAPAQEIATLDTPLSLSVAVDLAATPVTVAPWP